MFLRHISEMLDEYKKDWIDGSWEIVKTEK